MRTTNDFERRRAPRTRFAGSAFVHVNPWCCHRYRVVDLSAQGALLAGPHLRPGRRVRLVIQVDGAEPLWLDGRVVRQDMAGEEGVAVAFVSLEAATEDALQDLALAALSGQQVHTLPSDVSVDWVALPYDVANDEVEGYAEALQ